MSKTLRASTTGNRAFSKELELLSSEHFELVKIAGQRGIDSAIAVDW